MAGTQIEFLSQSAICPSTCQCVRLFTLLYLIFLGDNREQKKHVCRSCVRYVAPFKFTVCQEIVSSGVILNYNVHFEHSLNNIYDTEEGNSEFQN